MGLQPHPPAALAAGVYSPPPCPLPPWLQGPPVSQVLQELSAAQPAAAPELPPGTQGRSPAAADRTWQLPAPVQAVGVRPQQQWGYVPPPPPTSPAQPTQQGAAPALASLGLDLHQLQGVAPALLKASAGRLKVCKIFLGVLVLDVLVCFI
jgi:hypothetical protein